MHQSKRDRSISWDCPFREIYKLTLIFSGGNLRENTFGTGLRNLWSGGVRMNVRRLIVDWWSGSLICDHWQHDHSLIPEKGRREGGTAQAFPYSHQSKTSFIFKHYKEICSACIYCHKLTNDCRVILVISAVFKCFIFRKKKHTLSTAKSFFPDRLYIVQNLNQQTI